jgi:hypothetical protein
LPSFIATLTRGHRGVSALVYREIHAPADVASSTEQAIAAMESRPATIATLDFAVELRQRKHVDPIRGVISAYLYDSIGDIDSIRRMAFYYAEHHQPIPYDIAFLAQLDGGWQGLNLVADVPAVAARDPRTAAEKTFEWTHAATQARSGIVVAGLCPWLRQGWVYLDDPSDFGSPLIPPGLSEIRDYLCPARFTTLDKRGAELMRNAFSLTTAH